MKILIISIGKKHDEFIKDAIFDFQKRIESQFSLEWKIISSISKEEEGQKIVDCIKSDDFMIALDEQGKELKTKEFSNILESKLNLGTKRIVFVIGGSYGLSQDVLDRADFTWSLSLLTFPHQLVRLILIEQIYRALSILNGGKYHHE